MTLGSKERTTKRGSGEPSLRDGIASILAVARSNGIGISEAEAAEVFLEGATTNAIRAAGYRSLLFTATNALNAGRVGEYEKAIRLSTPAVRERTIARLEGIASVVAGLLREARAVAPVTVAAKPTEAKK